MNKQALDRLHTGELYLPGDEEILEEQMKYMELVDTYNRTGPYEYERRSELLKEMFEYYAGDSYIEPPFHANFGGKFVRMGTGCYANSNFTLVDDTSITIGDHCMFGPNVTLATAGHPIHPSLRRDGYQFNLPIVIGTNCWLGAGVIVMPGVTIGENSVIGAGSIVTKDIPANVVAFGNPCKVHREINDEDYEYYHKQRKIPEILR